MPAIETVKTCGGNTMKKEKVFNEVPPIPSQDHPIVREEAEDGTITYRHPVGSPVKTHAVEFDMFVGMMDERYKSLLALLDEDDHLKFGILFEALAAYNLRQLDEMLEFLFRCVGKIDFHYVERADNVYRSGRIVGISIETPEVIEARMAKAQGVAR
jgi:hypothetical protein